MSISYTAGASSMVFHIPSSLAADFESFLNYDIPNVNKDFTVYHNWYDKDTSGFTPPVVRAEVYPDTAKSRYTNTDNHLNLRASLSSGIRKGDILTDSDGKKYLLDWNAMKELNNISSRLLECNATIVVKRYQHETVDSLGYLVTEGGEVTVAASIPCNLYRYDGKPDYSASNGNAGIVPNAITICTIQFNTATDNIRVNDTFEWDHCKYLVVDVNAVGVDIDNSYGLLTLQCIKDSGGETT